MTKFGSVQVIVKYPLMRMTSSNLLCIGREVSSFKTFWGWWTLLSPLYVHRESDLSANPTPPLSKVSEVRCLIK